PDLCVDQAVVDEHDLVGAVHMQPSSALGERDVAHPGPPAEGRRDLLDHHVHVQAGQALQLLADHARLETALGGGVDVLEVAPTTGTGSGVGARGRDPVGRRGHDGDGVTTPEAVAVTALGDLHDDPLTGQRVPHEDDTVAPGVVGRHARHAVATVCHGADLD